MKTWVFVGLLLVGSLAHAQADVCEWNDCSGPSAGPGPCVPHWMCPVLPPGGALPVGPSELCFGLDGCSSVQYRLDGSFLLAETVLPNGFAVLGWAGPCLGPLTGCPDLANQAFSDLRLNAYRIYRGVRFGL